MTEELEKYILAHIDPEDNLLAKLRRDTHVNLLRPRMVSGHLQGKILKMICRMIQPQYVLEIGTFTGYSAISMAAGMKSGSELHTFEINDELEDFTRSFLEQSEHKEKIFFHIGDALELVPAMDKLFDLVFIDGDKRNYIEYYDCVFPKVKKGGLILADNTLWDGKVIENVANSDTQTKGILAFNNKIAADSRVEKVILPLRDGLTMILKL
ncbi:MAG TPA: O-methyltransferase [Bacteroidales bacterium]